MTPKHKAHQRREKEAINNEEKRRFYHRNIKAQRWCNKEGFTLYAAAQAHNSSYVKVFKQKGEKFLPVNDIEYNQNEQSEVVSYIALIDAEYERMYNLRK
jgi:predicted ATPase